MRNKPCGLAEGYMEYTKLPFDTEKIINIAI